MDEPVENRIGCLHGRVVGRHVFRLDALKALTVQPVVNSDTLALVVHLDRHGARSRIDHFADELVAYVVVLLQHTHAIRRVDLRLRGYTPNDTAAMLGDQTH